MTTGHKVTDVIRFFHLDGPAQQFESGNTVGRKYSCVSCSAGSDRMDDLAYSYRCTKLTLSERQEFLLKGKAGRNLQTRPLDKLLLTNLQELRLRNRSTSGKKKPTLEKEFDELRMGNSNFPALLQDSPRATLASLHRGTYEISPTEPLHDLKGHFGNIIEESLVISSDNTREAIAAVKRTVLCKDTIRCSDLRKALIYVKLNTINPDASITQLYRTAVEISYLLYTHD